MTPLQEARARHTLAVFSAIQTGDGCPGENDFDVNNSAWEVVEAMGPGAVLGVINLHGTGEPIMWKAGTMDRQPDYVLPDWDRELLKLISDRVQAPYTGTREDSKRVQAIMARVEAVGGVHLVWT